jgi:adenylosuccinate synthase
VGVDVLLGLQWGDEGKGKIVDYLAPKYNLVCRFQGGPNAGHTLEFDNIKHVLHQIPSGVFRENIDNIIGNGVVLDSVVFKKEVEALNNLGVDCRKNLYISKRTSLILPTHRLLDAAYEAAKGEDKIGSTLRGIGPTYQDKIGRLGLRVGDIIFSDFISKYRSLVDRHEDILNHLNYEYNLEELETEFFKSVEFLKTFNLADNELLVNKAIDDGKTILAEGAQGSLLDIDFGSYPFVTSSSTMAAGACTGLGVAPSRIGEVFGIFKAYCTRVGSGPFPTELFDETGERLRKEGAEFGATTGRPRRCGWLDLPALKYSVTINGVTQLFMMKSDVLNNFDEIKICTGYKLQDGSETSRLTFESLNEKIEPVYRSFKGWNCSLDGIDDFQKLPEELLEYVEYIESELNVPINIVSVGPNRNETIIRNQVMA